MTTTQAALSALSKAIARQKELEGICEKMRTSLQFTLPYMQDLDDGEMRGFTSGVNKIKETLAEYSLVKEKK